MDTYLLIAMATMENPDAVHAEQLKANAACALRDNAAYNYYNAPEGADLAKLAAIAAACSAACGDRAAAEHWIDTYFEHTVEAPEDYLNQINNNVFNLA